MAKIAFVGESRLGLLFNSFDITSFAVSNGEEALNKIIELSRSKEYTIILTSEDYIASIGDYLSNRQEISPVIFMLPSKENRGESVSVIRDVVEKAVGIDILSKNKLQGE